MGRWSAAHRKKAIFGWLAFIVVSIFIGMQAGTISIKNQDKNSGESKRGDHIVNDAGFNKNVNKKQAEFILVQSKATTAKSPEFRAAVNDAIAAVGANEAVESIRGPYGFPGQISKDGHSAYVSFDIRGEYKTAVKQVDPLVASVRRVEQAHDGYYVKEVGDATLEKAMDKVFGEAERKSELISWPLTMAILIFVFGALVAAGIPLLLGITSVLGTLGLVSIVSHVMPMDGAVPVVIILVGLAVGVDYSLFYLKREREERAAGRSEAAALEAAAATSGRSVLISGLTVIVAMAGMLLSGDPSFMSFGIATAMVVAVAMVGSLTVLPALLSKLGDKVNKGKVPFLYKYRVRQTEPRMWRAMLRPVLRHPVIAAVASAGLLLALSLPALGLHTALSGTSALPHNVKEVKVLDKFTEEFPGGPMPAIVAIKANLDDPKVHNAIVKLEKRADASGQMRNAHIDQANASRTTATVTVDLQGDGNDAKSNAALQTLREEILPETLGQVEGIEYAVTGNTANSKDYNDLLKSHAPYVFGFVLLFAFLLLLVAFRSIVIAFKAIVMNLLSVGAAYGLLVLVFQKGWGEGILNFQSNGAITSWLPIFLFVILFGLSMDYHVFILSRIREAFDRGLSTRDAVEHGITTTAGVVTSAAVVMAGAFGVFMLLPYLDFMELGLGLGAAVIIDATIVRAVLLPATMTLLGDANWYLPKWLEWLPKLEHEEASEPAQAVPALNRAA
jgi:RND superfamily putative drug exporter